MLKSTAFSLKLTDYLKSFVIAVGTPVLYLVQELIPGWNIPPLAKAAIAASVTYLLKNFFTNDVAVAEKTIESAALKQGKDATEEKGKIMQSAFKGNGYGGAAN